MTKPNELDMVFTVPAVSVPAATPVVATPVDSPPAIDLAIESFEEPQARLLQLVSEGLTVTTAAQRSAVGRATVYRWQHNDPRFAAALKAARRRRHEEVFEELEALAPEAMLNVRNAITAGDDRISLALLRLLGMLRPPAKE